MERNCKDLLIELFVPSTAGNGSGKIGTGFPIAKDRILTARHVLFGDGRDEAVDFELRWHHWRGSGKPAGKWQRVARKQILCKGSDDLDAAVIEHPFPPEVCDWLPLTARNHATGTRWESEGFPDVGKREDDSREAVPMQGKTYRYASRAKDAWLDVDKPPVPAGWKGASGSPVIVLSQVAGILTDVPPGFQGGRLKALPASRLLADEQFREAIGYRTGGDRTAALVTVLTPWLRRYPLAIGALECGIEGAGGALWRDPAKPVDTLAEALNDCNVTELLRFARDAIKALKKAGHPDDAHALGELVQQLLPILYDHTAVDALREKVDDPAAVLVGLPIATAFVAETVMAGVDGRETRWQPPDPKRELEGQLRLPNTPNSGIDPTGARALESFGEHLRRKLAANELQDFESAFYRCLSEFVPMDQRARLGAQKDDLYDIAADEVTYLAEENSRYYYLFQLPSDSEHRAQALETLARLKDRFKAVTFMEFADDGKLMRAESNDFRPLKDILSAMEN